jgi:hypothetical protein
MHTDGYENVDDALGAKMYMYGCEGDQHQEDNCKFEMG